MSKERITKTFAEELGQSLGGCATELTIGGYYREAAHRARARLNPIPFLGMKKKRRFQILWSCCLEAVALWTAVRLVPELTQNERLSAKTLFQMQSYNNSVLSAAFLPYFNAEEMNGFARIRKAFVRLSEKDGVEKEDFARELLAHIHETTPEAVDSQLVTAMASELGLAVNVFQKMINIHLEKLGANQDRAANES